MKKVIIAALMLSAMPLASAAQSCVIENPSWIKRSVGASGIAIEKVEATPEETILHFKCWLGYAEGAMSIPKDCYILENGKRLMLKEAAGVPLDSMFRSNAEGFTRTFSLTFPAVDTLAKTVDFIESDCPDCIRFYGVPVTPESEKANKEIRKQADDRIAQITSMADDGKPLEQNRLMLGSATIKGRILGYQKELFEGSEVSIACYVNNPLLNTQITYAARLASDGSFEMSLPLTSKKETVLLKVSPLFHGYVLVGDGQAEEFVVDLDRLGDYMYVDQNMYMYFDGDNAEFNNVQIKYKEIGQLDYEKVQELESGRDPEKFKSGVLALAAAQKSKIDSSEMPGRVKQYLKLNIDLTLASMLSRAPTNFFFDQQREAISNGKDPREAVAEQPVFSIDYFKYYSQIDINDPNNLYFSDLGQVNMYARANLRSYVNGHGTSLKILDAFNKAREDGWMNPEYEKAVKILSGGSIPEEKRSIVGQAWNGLQDDFAKMITGKQSGMVFDMDRCAEICSPLRKGQPVPEPGISELEKMGSPVYAQFARSENAKIAASKEAEKKRGGYYKHAAGESAADSILVELLKGHEGKAVLIDLWATWCGPCRSAMQEMAPFIDDFIERGVDFVYVADDSSDEEEYKKIASASKGTHHKISEASMASLKEKFGFSGIPAYVLVDRKGFVNETPRWFEGPDWMKMKLDEMDSGN